MKIEIVRERLDHMVLSERARDAVDSCDMRGLIEMFGDCKTAEDVETVVEEYFD